MNAAGPVKRKCLKTGDYGVKYQRSLYKTRILNNRLLRNESDGTLCISITNFTETEDGFVISNTDTSIELLLYSDQAPLSCH